MDKYEEALEKARELHGTVAAGRDFLAEIFPELRESEDERIRKWLIEEIKATHDYDSPTSKKCVDDALAYLEKQKESTWTEEDERLFDSTVWHLRNSVNNGDTEHSAGQLEDWFKSIRHYRNRTGVDKRISQEILDYFNEKKDYRLRWYNWVQYAGRENWWMPSEEQMNALYDILHPADPVNLDAVKSLYNDLKEL